MSSTQVNDGYSLLNINNDDSGKKLVRIAILLGAPLTEQNFERIGIPYLSPYFEVIVFDCLDWLGRSSSQVDCKKTYWQHKIEIKTELELEIATKKYQPDYVIDAIGLSIHTLKAKNIFGKYNVNFVALIMGNQPAPSMVSKVKDFLGKRGSINDEPIKGLKSTSNGREQRTSNGASCWTLIKKIISKLKQLRSYKRITFSSDIALLAGNKALNFFTKKAHKIIWIGSQDFHQFNKTKIDLKASKKQDKKIPFILFIDDCLAFANDWKLLGLKPPVTAAEYFPVLCSYFERIESLYGMPVVISGHPNSKFDNSYSGNMGGREVIFDSTASLVLESTLVLTHRSTAISFAVLARKPTLFLTTRSLDNSPYGIGIRSLARNLGSSLLFMDQPIKEAVNASLPLVNVKKYQLYEVNYLKSEQSNESEPWQAFIDHVNKEIMNVQRLS